MSDFRRRCERGASTRHETRRSARYGARFRISSSARERDLSCPTRSPNSARPFTPCRHDSLTPIHGAPAPSGEAGRGAHPIGRAVAPTRESGARSRPGQRPSDEIRAPSLPPPTGPEIIRALHLTLEQKANILVDIRWMKREREERWLAWFENWRGMRFPSGPWCRSWRWSPCGETSSARLVYFENKSSTFGEVSASGASTSPKVLLRRGGRFMVRSFERRLES